jgi:hypothetical protein
MELDTESHGYLIIRDLGEDNPPMVMLELGFDSDAEALEHVNTDPAVTRHHEHFSLDPQCKADCQRCHINIAEDAILVTGQLDELVSALIFHLHDLDAIISGNILSAQIGESLRQSGIFNDPSMN